MNKMVVHGFGCRHLNDVQMWVIFYRTQINNVIFAASLLSMVLLYRVSFCISKTIFKYFNLHKDHGVFFLDFAFQHSR